MLMILINLVIEKSKVWLIVGLEIGSDTLFMYYYFENNLHIFLWLILLEK